MRIINHTALVHEALQGVQRTCVAGTSQGIHGFEVWVDQVDPGASTPLSRHGGELVLVAMDGSGKLLLADGPQRFQAPCTLVVPAGAEHQVANVGTGVLRLITVRAA
jgi:mannose-6-phosphate isomerase-like protein (cupin superfamily)